jgi:hypothetical protein
MKRYLSPDKFSSRRLDRATKHVSSLWFPINPGVLSLIRNKLLNNSYSDFEREIFEDLKQDFALFTFLIKELTVYALKERVEQRTVNNPFELISWADPELIKSILCDDSRLPTNHLLESVSHLQALRLRETAVVASTAEVLSARKNLNPDTGFSRGVIRETGLNLIAWNYPSLYSRVVKNLTKGQSVDEQLSNELGFSPVTLAMRVLHPSSPLTDGSERALHDSTWDNYDQLCDIGAALARADNPETYPSAENDWRLANEYLQKTVGSDGVTLIRIKAAEYSEEYKRSLKEIFKPLRDFDPEKSIQRHKNQGQSRRNRYINQCDPEVQDALRELYTRLCDTRSTGDALESLIRRIIPDAGFTGGCVFLVDPAAFALMPRTVFGSVRLRSVERIHLKQQYSEQQSNSAFNGSGQSGQGEPDLAATALSCAQPVIERHDDMHSLGLTGMYASLGESKKVGVLYLEAPETIDANEDHRIICTFKAMRQALADALKLD